MPHFKIALPLGAATCALALAGTALPAAGQDLDVLRREIQQMQQQNQAELEKIRRDYETRLQTMEERLKAAETTVEAKSTAASRPSGKETQPSPAAFNPAIGVVLDGKFTRTKRDSGNYRIPGFAVGGEAGPPQRGLAIGESEMNLSSNIDQSLFGNLTIAYDGQGAAAVEEAYLQTTALPAGLTLRAGRFFSGIGYLNEQHAHTWDFADAPLTHRAFLNTQYGDDGVQLRWLAPTNFFFEVGAEAFRGAGFPAGGAANRGVGTYGLFAHVGDDLNQSSNFRTGLSLLTTTANNRQTTSEFGTDSFSGDSNTFIYDLVYNWAPDGNRTDQYLKLQGEYFLRQEQGRFNALPYSAGQTGWYLQAIYQFMPKWRVGLRHDRVASELPDITLAGTILDPNGANPHRSSAMIDYSTSEFGRFRLQFNRDQSGPEIDNQALLQYTVSFGAHGAHSY
jgi:hypothetical protein